MNISSKAHEQPRTSFLGQDVNRTFLLFFIPISWLQCVVGSVGALSVLTVIFMHKKVSNHHLFIANLALTDLGTLGYWWVFFAVDLCTGRHPVANNVHCAFNGFFIITLSEMYVSSLIMVSLNRYVLICRFKQYDKIFSKKNTQLAIMLIWISGFGFSTVPFIIQRDPYGYKPDMRICAVNLKMNAVAVIWNMVYVLAPLLFVGSLNCAIYRFWEKANVNLVQVYFKTTTRDSGQFVRPSVPCDEDDLSDNTVGLISVDTNLKNAIRERRRTLQNLFEERSTSVTEETDECEIFGLPFVDSPGVQTVQSALPTTATADQSPVNVQDGEQECSSSAAGESKLTVTSSLSKFGSAPFDPYETPDVGTTSSTLQETTPSIANTPSSIQTSFTNFPSRLDQDSAYCTHSALSSHPNITNSQTKCEAQQEVPTTRLASSGKAQGYNEDLPGGTQQEVPNSRLASSGEVQSCDVNLHKIATETQKDTPVASAKTIPETFRNDNRNENQTNNNGPVEKTKDNNDSVTPAGEKDQAGLCCTSIRKLKLSVPILRKKNRQTLKLSVPFLRKKNRRTLKLSVPILREKNRRTLKLSVPVPRKKKRRTDHLWSEISGLEQASERETSCYSSVNTQLTMLDPDDHQQNIPPLPVPTFCSVEEETTPATFPELVRTHKVSFFETTSKRLSTPEAEVTRFSSRNQSQEHPNTRREWLRCSINLLRRNRHSSVSHDNLKRWRQFKRKKGRPSEIFRGSTLGSISSVMSEYAERRMEKIKEREHAVIRSLLAVFIMTCVSFIPYGAVSIAMNLTVVPAEVKITSIVLLYVNNACNWVIYGIMSPTLSPRYRELYERIRDWLCSWSSLQLRFPLQRDGDSVVRESV